MRATEGQLRPRGDSVTRRTASASTDTPRLTLLDCSLREGAYLRPFTPQETAQVTAQLVGLGISMIEIGHGVGIGAGPEHGAAPFDAEAYLDAVSAAAPHARVGMFYIPGIGAARLLERAARHGLNFVRIGTNVSDTRSGERVVRQAKDLGLHVSFNFMKSYLCTPVELARLGQAAASWGADAVSVVDSAGCMLPNNVAEYVTQVVNLTGVPVGFHGHNNLQLAVANSLAAIESGATIIDGTIRGAGRGGGNTPTEILVAALSMRGVATGLDPVAVLRVADRVSQALWPAAAWGAGTSVVTALNRFHSSHLPLVEIMATFCGVDLWQLIAEVGATGAEEPSRELVRARAAGLSGRRER